MSEQHRRKIADLYHLLNQSDIISLEQYPTYRPTVREGCDEISGRTPTQLSSRFCILNVYFSGFIYHNIHELIETLGHRM